ncbi:MAG: Glucosyltransferase-like protein [Sclerophora amabilis]|nr:MAG: Glucosyltransferase-like protein [Sclerophora amabilis]
MVTALSFLVLFAPLLVGSYLQGAVYGTKGDILPVTLPDLPSGPFLARLRQDTTAWYFPLLQQLSQSVHRIFPFARGIFEDKVANLWCTLNVFIKLRQYPISLLQRISLVATLASIIPPCSLLFVKPGPDNILYALAATGWGFFLCSFQVHEKSVLLPLLPMTLLLAVRSGATPPIRAWVGWANILGVWTMYPLLKRDELRIPYFALTLVWAYLLGLPPASPSIYLEDRQGDENALGIGTKALHLSFYSLMILWHFAEAFLPPPEGKPDLWVVLNVGIGAVGFGFCYLWCVWQGAQASGIFRSGPEDEKSVTKGKARVR